MAKFKVCLTRDILTASGKPSFDTAPLEIGRKLGEEGHDQQHEPAERKEKKNVPRSVVNARFTISMRTTR